MGAKYTSQTFARVMIMVTITGYMNKNNLRHGNGRWKVVFTLVKLYVRIYKIIETNLVGVI